MRERVSAQFVAGKDHIRICRKRDGQGIVSKIGHQDKFLRWPRKVPMYCNASITLDFVVCVDDATGKKTRHDVLAAQR